MAKGVRSNDRFSTCDGGILAAIISYQFTVYVGYKALRTVSHVETNSLPQPCLVVSGLIRFLSAERYVARWLRPLHPPPFFKKSLPRRNLVAPPPGKGKMKSTSKATEYGVIDFFIRCPPWRHSKSAWQPVTGGKKCFRTYRLSWLMRVRSFVALVWV